MAVGSAATETSKRPNDAPTAPWRKPRREPGAVRRHPLQPIGKRDGLMAEKVGYSSWWSISCGSARSASAVRSRWSGQMEKELVQERQC